MNLSDFSMIAFEMNAALDAGHHGTVTVDQVHEVIDNGGSILQWLPDQFPPRTFDFSLYDDEKRRKVDAVFADMSAAISEGRKMGVRNDGLCLILAYCIEALQNFDTWSEIGDAA